MYMFCRHCKREFENVDMFRHIHFWIFKLCRAKKYIKCPYCREKNVKPCLYDKIDGKPALFVCNGGELPRELFADFFKLLESENEKRN